MCSMVIVALFGPSKLVNGFPRRRFPPYPASTTPAFVWPVRLDYLDSINRLHRPAAIRFSIKGSATIICLG
ncbi:uncharacterized protein BDW70DRAFT_131137 [Aspergillus foveolatus]|uniref:uncharacterized protein n=1 Tax=Aspergillus foveolatus TaxID=210207 RepID=UPI003CCDE0A6